MKNPYVIAFLILFFLVLDLVLTGMLVGLEKGTWPDWVGALGTVGAFAGTIWLATNARRERLSRERARARIQAVLVFIRLAEMSKRYKTYLDIFNKVDGTKTQKAFIVVEENVSNFQLGTIDDFADLICVQGDVSKQLATIVAGHATFMFQIRTGAKLTSGTDTSNNQIAAVKTTLALVISTMIPAQESLRKFNQFKEAGNSVDL